MTYQLLIMEDDFDIAAQWGSACRDRGMEVTLAGHRTEAEAHLWNQQYDALVTDMFVRSNGQIAAGDGGLLLISHIRAPGLAVTPEWAATMPILAVSAAQATQAADPLDHATHGGATDVMRKPFTPEELAERVWNLIKSSKRRKQQ